MRRRVFKKSTPFRLVSTAVVGVSMGSLLAVVLLLLEEPKKVAEIPGPEAKHVAGDFRVLYQPGLMAGSQPSSNFERSRKYFNLRSPGQLPFLERDLNAYFNQLRSGADGSGEGVAFGAPNIRITEEGIVLSVLATVNPETSQKFDVTAQIFGNFEMSNSGPELVVDSLHLNSLRVPLGSVIADRLIRGFMGLAIPAESVEAWAQIEAIELNDGRMSVKMGART
ncbi:MAG: hypothetical protein AAGB46_15225 [Verrucomicrobiota bacterium]